MGNCGEALKVKVSSIWNKAFTVLSGVAILSEKRLHLFQMSPSRAKSVLWATYKPNPFLSFSQKDNGYIFYSMKDTGGWKDSRSWTGWWNIWAIVLLFNLMHAFQWVYQRLPDNCGWRTLHKINILSSGDSVSVWGCSWQGSKIQLKFERWNSQSSFQRVSVITWSKQPLNRNFFSSLTTTLIFLFFA